VADGTHFEIYEDNLLAEHHIRYGKTGGIAYRHIADNYIALFSRFIACGTYEATYILDALLENLSDLHPKRVHADTHGRSAAVFGLAYLLGIELMPRIRRWRKLNLYRSERSQYYLRRDPLFSGTVKHLAFGEHGLLRSNDPSDQEKAIVYNELVANAVVLQNVVDQTQALHALKSEGTRFSNADLAHLSPYGTSNLKRFGKFPTDLIPDPVPVERGLPS
jgi:TnpA family transposase